ncbi:hypothetical protein [Nonomuraea maritima]|uniref:hypothetical protein n=1 Tax=Nonomuraea maritima TaxID=683260 RepID=UPI003715F189
MPHSTQTDGTPISASARRSTAPRVRPDPGGRGARTGAGSLRDPVSTALVRRRSKCAVSMPCRAMYRRRRRLFVSPARRPRRRIISATDRDLAAADLTSPASSRIRW